MELSAWSGNVNVLFVLSVPQRIRSTVDEKEQKQLLMDLDVVMRSSDCPYIVQFYGALFREVGQTRTDLKCTIPFSSVYNVAKLWNLICHH